MLTDEQIQHYKEEGYVKVEQLFSPDEVQELGDDMNCIIETWGEEIIGWHGPWRDRYLSEDERLNTKAVFMHRPDHFSAVWSRSYHHKGLVSCIAQLVGPTMQWHHTVLHGKPPELGTPFPMHQDYPFYPHEGPDFIDCLLHLDDAPAESGCLRVVPGSHKNGPLEHNTGPDTAPHLPPEKYHPDFLDSIEIPAKAGDVIFFSYLLIHWSDVNRTDKWRRGVRYGYHTPEMHPVGKDPSEPNHNTIVCGFKERRNEPKPTIASADARKPGGAEIEGEVVSV
jgi:phytanoyl-CoA hydroxylase